MSAKTKTILKSSLPGTTMPRDDKSDLQPLRFSEGSGVPVVPQPRGSVDWGPAGATAQSFDLSQELVNAMSPLFEARRSGAGSSKQKITKEIELLARDVEELSRITDFDERATGYYLKGLPDELQRGFKWFTGYTTAHTPKPQSYFIAPAPHRIAERLLQRRRDVEKDLEVVLSLMTKLSNRLLNHLKEMVDVRTKAEKDGDSGMLQEAIAVSEVFLSGAMFFAPQAAAMATYMHTKLYFDTTKECIEKVLDLVYLRLNLDIMCQEAKINYRNRAYTLLIAKDQGLDQYSVEDYIKLLKANLIPSTHSRDMTAQAVKAAKELKNDLQQMCVGFDETKKDLAPVSGLPIYLQDMAGQLQHDLLFRAGGTDTQSGPDPFTYRVEVPIDFSGDNPADTGVLLSYDRAVAMAGKSDRLNRLFRKMLGNDRAASGRCRLSFRGGVRTLDELIAQLEGELDNDGGVFRWRNQAIGELENINKAWKAYLKKKENLKGDGSDPANADEMVAELKNVTEPMHTLMIKAMEPADSFASPYESRQRCPRPTCGRMPESEEHKERTDCYNCGEFKRFTQMKRSTMEGEEMPDLGDDVHGLQKTVTINDIMEVRMISPPASYSGSDDSIPSKGADADADEDGQEATASVTTCHRDSSDKEAEVPKQASANPSTAHRSPSDRDGAEKQDSAPSRQAPKRANVFMETAMRKSDGIDDRVKKLVAQTDKSTKEALKSIPRPESRSSLRANI